MLDCTLNTGWLFFEAAGRKLLIIMYCQIRQKLLMWNFQVLGEVIVKFQLASTYLNLFKVHIVTNM